MDKIIQMKLWIPNQKLSNMKEEVLSVGLSLQNIFDGKLQVFHPQSVHSHLQSNPNMLQRMFVQHLRVIRLRLTNNEIGWWLYRARDIEDKVKKRIRRARAESHPI